LKYFGVDPGKKGGIAVISARGKMLGLSPMPMVADENGKTQYDVETIISNMSFWKPAIVCVELMTGPPVGVNAIYARGHARAFAWAAKALGMEVYEVPSRTWQKQMLPKAKMSSTKTRALIAARLRFPGQSWKATARCRIAHDGMVDAALIAEYSRLTHGYLHIGSK